MNIEQCLNLALNKLDGREDSMLESEMLLCHVLDKDKMFIKMNPKYELSEYNQKEFHRHLEILEKNTPIEHITGEKEFFAMDFHVSEDVLIPRFDTEVLVENVLYLLKKDYKLFPNPFENDEEILKLRDNLIQRKNFHGYEIGCGSGIISISLLKNNENLTMVASDIDRKAMHLTKKNAQKHQVMDRLKVQFSDIFSEIRDQKFDFIVSNPPYISTSDMKTLDPMVKDNEPHVALWGGTDGLYYYKRIIKHSGEYLHDGGFLAFEIGYDQGDSVKELLVSHDYKHVKVIKDYSSLDRLVIGWKI